MQADSASASRAPLARASVGLVREVDLTNPYIDAIEEIIDVTLIREAGLRVVVDAMYGTALPVDPGEHVVFVKRDDELLKTEKIKVVEAQTAEVTLDLAHDHVDEDPTPPLGQRAQLTLSRGEHRRHGVRDPL